ncbi:hypothetical protein [Ensifer adhaerens]|uniref:hypothetical protein n=1 Tax=Ensifer adhaerens TaxID=106592 RepID=UPI00132E9763|nr:hypothetical protein [Ensifer adhaerens]QHG74442.1 hypothetical protein DQW09_32150 [Ensifer adhaerens]
MTREDLLPDLLLLHIETREFAPAGDLGNLLLTLNAAFERFGRRRMKSASPTLAVRDIRHGSIDIVLDALDGAQKLWEGRELLAPFAAHLMDVASLLLGTSDGKVAPIDRKAVEAIANPVAKDHAVQINLVVNGNVHLAMDKTMAQALAIARELQAERSVQAVAHAVATPLIDRRQTEALEQDGVFGTALDVDGQWYARLEGGQGVLVPLMANEHLLATLRHRTPYRFKGTVRRGRHGEQVGINVQDVA